MFGSCLKGPGIRSSHTCPKLVLRSQQAKFEVLSYGVLGPLTLHIPKVYAYIYIYTYSCTYVCMYVYL